MLLAGTRVNGVVFLVFPTLEVTEVLPVIGYFMEAHGQANSGRVHAGGWAGILASTVAWYTSAALVVNGQVGRATLPIGHPLWREGGSVGLAGHRHVPA